MKKICIYILGCNVQLCCFGLFFQNANRFSNRGDALQWAACVSLSAQETDNLKDATVNKIVAESVKRQVVSALTNFTDIDMNFRILRYLFRHVIFSYSFLCLF